MASPRAGPVSPSEFIPVAEDIGLILPLGEWVLQQACATAATWPRGIRVAVNLSAVQFRKSNLVQRVASVLAKSGLDPSRLELEITEIGLATRYGDDGCYAARVAGTRHPHCDGRFWHRVFVTELSAAAFRSTRSRSINRLSEKCPRAPTVWRLFSPSQVLARASA